jgi:hypothetical protein
MKKMGLKLLVLVIIGFMVGCATSPRQVETVQFSLPKDFEAKRLKEGKYVKTFALKKARITRFVLEGKSIDVWTEALELFNTGRKNFPPTPEEAYEHLMEDRQKICPESSFNVIGKDSSTILYEMKTINCSPYQDENSITRIIYGNTDVFMLIYTIKIRDIPKEKRDEWIKTLSAAHMVAIDK